MIQPAETATMLVLSTAHLRQSTCETWLREECSCAHEKQGVGWFVYVCEDPAQGGAAPNELLAIFEFAREHGCLWIMFDCDGPQQDGLVVYDW